MIPYITAYSFLENYSNEISILNSMLALFILILIVDWSSFLILLFLAISAAYIKYNFIYHLPPIKFKDIETSIYTFVFTILAGILFSRNAARSRANLILQQQLDAVRTVAASIAHELRTPLLSIKSGAAGIKEFVPRLLQAYKVAEAHKLEIPSIRASQVTLIEKVIDNIGSEVNFSNSVIDSLLTNAFQNNLKLTMNAPHDIASSVKGAILRYPFNPKSKIEIVHFDDANSFIYHGDDLLVTHVIFNLLKNALYAIADAEKGEIYIHLEPGKKMNYLYFRDTGKGINKEFLSTLFQPFQTNKPNSTGIGLAFSKMVMTNVGGDISIDSVEGEYTEITLSFPVVTEEIKAKQK
jgi:signal transduction histidine kinase